MNNSWLSEWSEQKVQLANRLSKGDCGGSYAESVLILCSVLSGISAEVWPGKGHDRKRFVELLINYSSPSAYANMVSVPLLTGYLRDSGKTILSENVQNQLLPYSDDRILTGLDVDKSIDELTRLFPEVDTKTAKRHSYANLLYEEIRSGYAHEYRPGNRSESWDMGATCQNCHVSYVNMVTKLDRLIYFNVSWLIELVKSVVANLTALEDIPVFCDYSEWWLE